MRLGLGLTVTRPGVVDLSTPTAAVPPALPELVIVDEPATASAPVWTGLVESTSSRWVVED